MMFVARGVSSPELRSLRSLRLQRVEHRAERGRLDFGFFLRALGSGAVIHAVDEAATLMPDVDRAAAYIGDDLPRATAWVGAIKATQIDW